MKLQDYLNLMPEGNELAVWDKNYDIETYFYSDRPDSDDRWGKSMRELTEILDIVQINMNGVTVNLSDMIEKKMDEMSALFDQCDIDDIMENIPDIFAGNVSEDWIERFVDIICDKLQKQIHFASGRVEIYDAQGLKMLIDKVKAGKGVFTFAENYYYPLDIIFDFYGEKDNDNKSFCVVDEKLKERLIEICE